MLNFIFGHLARRFWLGFTMAVLCASCGRGENGASGPFTIPGVPSTPSFAPLPLSSQIVFTSDRSVVLPGAGASYQLVAQVFAGNAPSATPITWTSTDTNIATVSPSGNVTATGPVGATTIVASSPGLDSQSATVVVAQPTPGSVIVPSSSVLSSTQSTAILKVDATTARIGVGSIIISGDKAGLLGKVTRVQTSGSQTRVAISPVPLWQAFKQLDIDVASAPMAMETTLSNGRVSIQSHGRELRNLPLGAFTCKNDVGASINVAIAGPSLSAAISTSIVANYHTTWTHGINDFRLSVVTTVPVKLTTGSVTVAVPGHVTARCTAKVPQFTLPGVLPLWPIDLVGPTVNMSLVVSIDANANATLSLEGPQLSETATLIDGVQYTAGTWQVIEQNSQTGPQFTRGGASFSASASANIQSTFRVDLGTTATLVGIPLTTADVAFGSVGADFDASMSSPFGDTRFAYAGPTWSASLHLQAGPELSLNGGLFGVLHEYFGVPTISKEWSLYDRTIPLGGSPAPSIMASPALVKSGSVALNSSVPPAYAGNRVVFVGYLNNADNGSVLAETTVASDGSARASWTPRLSDNGSYQIAALLFDPIFDFASLHLPYASPSKARIDVALTAQPLPTPTPPSSPSPSSPSPSSPAPSSSPSPPSSPAPSSSPSPTPNVLTFTALNPNVVNTTQALYQATLTAYGTNLANVKQVVFTLNPSSRGGPYIWKNTDADWSSKLTVNSDGTLTLRPIVTESKDPAGTTVWTVTLTDTSNTTASQTFTVNYSH